MEMNTYQSLALRTAGEHETENDALINWSLGLAGESGEFANMVKKYIYHGHYIDTKELAKELGDILWYVSQAAEVLGFSLEEVAATNIDKLARRYPDGFSEDASRNRKD